MSFRQSSARPQQSQSVDNDPFTSQLQQLRLAYANKQNFTDLHYRADRLDHDVDIVKRYHFWLQAGDAVRYLRIVDIPGTLSGKLLRLEAKLPPLTGHTEIEGNIIRSITNPPDLPPEELEDDSDDLTDQVESLPLFDTSANPSLYFTKQPRYKSEIPNLLACQGGCPATTPSPYVVELLGKTEDGKLVFPKLLNRSKAAITIQQWLETYKKWIHQLVSGVQYLHSKGIVHRDLRVDNLLWKLDKSEGVAGMETLDPDELPKNLVICDLESKWGQRQAPEIIHNGKTVDAGWTKYSDIWDVGNCIKCIIYGNAPINDVVVWDIPSPFAEMVKACQRPIPSERATPAELLKMLGPIS